MHKWQLRGIIKYKRSCQEVRLNQLAFLKGCPRCHGDIVEGRDGFGKYLSCLQCGFLVDLNPQETKASR